MEAASDEESDRAAVERMLNSLRKEKGTLRVVTGRGLQQVSAAHLAAYESSRRTPGSSAAADIFYQIFLSCSIC